MRHRLLLIAAIALAAAMVAPAADAATGDLTFTSCQSNAAIAGQSCAVDAGALNTVVGLQVSPDGRSAYALGQASSTLVVFDRDATTGALTMKSGADGCFANAATGSCTVLAGELSHPEALAISADGTSVYVVSSNVGGSSTATLVGFARDTTTGALTPLTGANGCFANSAVGDCTVLSGQLLRAGAVSISPDGSSVYTVSTLSVGDASGVIDVLSRDQTTGALTYGSCVASAVVGACSVSSGVFSVSSSSAKLAISPDGRNAYLNGRYSGSLAVFDRDVATGALTLKAGADGCFANASLGACTVLSGYLPSPLSTSISPDGRNVYVNAGGTGDDVDAIIVFTRDPTTGELTKLDGAGGCLASAALGDCAVVNPAGQSAGNFDSKGVAVSPDGLSAYVTSFNWNMLLAFDRSPATGSLTLKVGAAGCFADTAMAPCTTASNLLYAASPVIVSPDGRDVYTGSGFSTNPNVAAFARAVPALLDGAAPARGTTAGGTAVTITGSNLDRATAVAFGGRSATITARSRTSLTATAPAHAAGAVDIRVTTAAGSTTLAAAFRYVRPKPPRIVVGTTTAAYGRTIVTFRTRVTVAAAGMIRQTITRVVDGRRVTLCSTTSRVSRPGTAAIACVAGSPTRSALRRGDLRVRVVTRFAVAHAPAAERVRNVLVRHRR